MADGTTTSAGANTLARAASQKGMGWFKGDVVKPLAVGGIAGGVTVVVARYAVRNMFRPRNADGSIQAETNANGQLTDAGKRAQLYRAAAKVVVGLVAASLLKKYSPPAALGAALGPVIDAVADITAAKGFEVMDRWFQPQTNRPAGYVYGSAAAMS